VVKKEGGVLESQQNGKTEGGSAAAFGFGEKQKEDQGLHNYEIEGSTVTNERPGISHRPRGYRATRRRRE